MYPPSGEGQRREAGAVGTAGPDLPGSWHAPAAACRDTDARLAIQKLDTHRSFYELLSFCIYERIAGLFECMCKVAKMNYRRGLVIME